MAWTIQNGGPDDRELRAVVRKVVDATEPDMVILFGSAARRQMHRGSDVDLLVVKEVDDVRKLKSSARRALLKEDRSVDVLGANRRMLAERETAALGVFEKAIDDLRDPLILQYEPNRKQVLSEDRTYRILKFAE